MDGRELYIILMLAAQTLSTLVGTALGVFMGIKWANKQHKKEK